MAIDYTELESGHQWVGLLPSAARTATPNQQQVVFNGDVDEIVVVLNVTAYTAGSVTVKVEGVDPLSQAAYPLLTGTAVAATGATTLEVSPTMTAVANAVGQHVVPSTIRVTATHAGGTTATYSLTLIAPN